MEKLLRLQVREKKWETPDTATFVLDNAPDAAPLSYRPGQFLPLVLHKNGRELRRAYSFSSCPGVDDRPAITVKRVANGEVSNWLLSSVQPGDWLQAAEPNGQFLLPANHDKRLKNMVFVAAGSGIAPIFSQIKSLLSGEPTGPDVWLIYANRDRENTIFKAELDALLARHAGRFSLTYLFSREKNATEGIFAHLGHVLLESLLQQRFGKKIGRSLLASTWIYTCAPTALMRMTDMTARTLGFRPEQIRREAFLPDSRRAARTIDTQQVHNIRVVKSGETIDFQVFEGETILNGALRQGIALPYTCKSGVCFTCLARCVRGAVDVEFVEQTKRETVGGLVNTCIGYAASPHIELVYEASGTVPSSP